MPTVGDIIHRNQEIAMAGIFMFVLNCFLFILLDLPMNSTPNLNKTEENISATDSSYLITDDDKGNLVLNQKLSKCFSEHSEFNFLPISRATNFIDDNEVYLNETSHSFKALCSSTIPYNHGLCLQYLLIDFIKLTNSLNINLQFIEPSILFCLLPTARKFNLLTRGFKKAKMRGSRNVLTLGMMEEDAKIFDLASSRLKLIKSGFMLKRYPRLSKFSLESPQEALHHVLTKNRVMLHLVVFYKRHTYLWHPDLNASDLSLRWFLFSEEGAFDRFQTTSLSLDSTSISVQVPIDSRTFLLAAESSKFVECNEVPITSVNESVKNNVLESLHEIKTVFDLYMVKFWLWSKTLMGWYESCNILQYSPDLELSVALKTLEGYNFTALFVNTSCQSVKQDFNESLGAKLKCNDINVKIILMHEEKNISWYSYSDGLNVYRHTFPDFRICSGDVWGLRINIPCNVLNIKHFLE